MAEAQKQHPKAWTLQRDWWVFGTQNQPEYAWWSNMPNAVREVETRRISKMEPSGDHVRLIVEDFFGHQQYGIPSGRPISGDYSPGDVVLIADGVKDARASVLKVDDDANAVCVTPFDTKEWKIAYSSDLPTEENPDAPGLFPPGGCYLRKFDPPGTPRYYWGRVDKEHDIVHRDYGRRLVIGFCDAPGDLSIDGRADTTAKDYLELRRVVHDTTTHLIDRYGDACLDFYWSLFNEPDLAVAFWRVQDWNEAQKFYDYVVDGALKAFEDKGYDSNKVMIGGIEIGAIFRTHVAQPILEKMLRHCSPKAEGEGVLPLNQAYADPRLQGQLSRRVSSLCSENDGKGSPLDFISIHAYNRSETMAGKLKEGKRLALEIDPEYYSDLYVNSHESCPGWAPPPDVAANDSYLGNGYFSTWCADVVRRQLLQASLDPLYSHGETILTVWPWPPGNFSGLNGFTQLVDVDDDGDGKADRTETLPLPIFHFLGLLSDMQKNFRVLPEKKFGEHIVSGFSSQDEERAIVLLYSHHSLDTQSRSEKIFDIPLDLRGLPWKANLMTSEYRFDKNTNTFFELARELRDRPGNGPFSAEDAARAKSLSGLRTTKWGMYVPDPDGSIEFGVTLKGNAASIIVIEPQEETDTDWMVR